VDKTLVVWRRLGREHGEGQGYRVNPPEVVEEHILSKIEAFRQTPDADWRWRQINDDVLIERRDLTQPPGLENTFVYLPRRGWVLQKPWHCDWDGWRWYVHIGDIRYEERYGCWLFTDLFADVIVNEDNRTHSILDLDDLAQALDIGLIDPRQASRILRSTQELANLIRDGGFPPKELLDCRPDLERLGWW
jgi:hypothetical protein